MNSQFGLIGLAVMGENLAMNIARNGFRLSVYNRTWDVTQAVLERKPKDYPMTGFKTLREFVASLERPRKILLMVKAGAPVDAVIQDLKPLLERGDIIIDGGNSFFRDTDRRFEELAASGLVFFGMGVSGGEEGALWGPSLMPGGELKTYETLKPILSKIAAQVASGACVTFVGNRSAGHFVKMVHNGIEYGDMQLISEAYDLMRNVLKLKPPQLAQVFEGWNQTELQSFLIEITAKIVNFPDDQNGNGKRSRKTLIDVIRDQAGQKGTGKWTTQAALDLGVAIPTITAAVDARGMSARQGLRLAAAEVYPQPVAAVSASTKSWIEAIRQALFASKMCSYAQGFDLLAQASKAYDYDVHLGEMARIWEGGCIIRAGFLEDIRRAFDKNPQLPNLLIDPVFAKRIRKMLPAWRKVVGMAVARGLPVPAFSASLAYFDSLRRRRSPANLIQGQRDYFGAHTYERIDREGVFHTNWHADRR